MLENNKKEIYIL